MLPLPLKMKVRNTCFTPLYLLIYFNFHMIFSSVILQVSVNGKTFVSSNVTVTSLDCKVSNDLLLPSTLFISVSENQA